MLSSNYGNRNKEIKDFFKENGIDFRGKSERDISFGNVFVTDQLSNFAIYARGDDSEKDVYLKIFEKYDPIPGSINRKPEPSNPRKCCARWKHSENDEIIMISVVREIISASESKLSEDSLESEFIDNRENVYDVDKAFFDISKYSYKKLGGTLKKDLVPQRDELLRDLKEVFSRSGYTLVPLSSTNKKNGISIHRSGEKETEFELFVENGRKKNGRTIRICTNKWKAYLDTLVEDDYKSKPRDNWDQRNEYFLSLNEFEKFLSKVLNNSIYFEKKEIERQEDLRIIDNYERELEAKGLKGEDRIAVTKVRINQGVFRDKLLSRYNKCCLCSVSDKHFLIASHIKPWAECEPDEKLDIDNGFLLCPGHDKLFDLGFISFDDDGKLLVSEDLKENEIIFMNVQIGKSIKLTEKNRLYLEYHRKRNGFSVE